MELALGKWLEKLVLLLSLVVTVRASAGDNSAYYKNCVSNCLKQTCQNNILLYRKGMQESVTDQILHFAKYKNFEFKFFENLFQWNCRDECKYQCMHKTCEAFIARKWNIPQFHGKWPFVRFLAMQEPASVVFSALNFFVHFKGLIRFRQNVRPDAPLYGLWHAFGFICLNAWVWSMVFHARDFPVTELLDYVFAYSMVLATFWCMMVRALHGKSKRLTKFVTFLCVIFFLNHFVYLSYNTFDYAYNMKVNIYTGVLGGIGWVLWCLSQINKRRYVWKMLLFVILALSTVVLEVYDFPPVLWAFDAHSLWHLSSAPITILFYKFITDDCNQLRKEMDVDDKKKLL